MSPNNGTVHARYLFADWTLKSDDTATARCRGTCLTCQERSPDTAGPDEAQLWCLKHAGLTGHTAYELSAAGRFNATMAGAKAASDQAKGGVRTGAGSE